MIDPAKLFEEFNLTHLKCGIKATPEGRRQGIDLLGYAKSDLDSCGGEYERGQYRVSIMLLQQASEKACKSLLLLVGLSEKNDLRGYGHSSTKLGKAVLTKTDPFVHLLEYFDPSPDGVGLEAIEKREREIGEIALASRESIIEFVTESEEYAKDLLESVEVKLRKSKKLGVRTADVDAAFRSTKVMAFITPIFSIAFFTSPHAVSTRYPGRPSLEDYTPKLGIVGATPRLTIMLDKAIEAIKTRFC
jgi:HEPN domain-containing protein